MATVVRTIKNRAPSVALARRSALLSSVRGTTATAVRSAPVPTKGELCTVFIHAAVPMVGFGFMDNTVMIQAGDAIDQTIGVRFGLATLTAAAFGQIASDVSGICFGGVVEDLFTKLGLRVPQITAAQRQLRVVKVISTFGAVCGVVVGCLLGMTSLAFKDLEAAERQKRDKELDPIFRAVITEGSETLQAERTSLFIVDARNNLVWSRVAMDVKKQIVLPLDGSSLATACIRERKVINLADAYADPRFDSSVDVDSGFRTKSILCVPVLAADPPHACIGAVEVINKRSGHGFSEDDVRTATMLARHVGIFLDECRVQTMTLE
ncbi:hypothetical protein CTAYLR_004352 [Chrysophaeum taylorii]|uniref:GAF domain-containing protein n=1 Tax=Chrysophaeum taylorii TaxID=2483200 RepID=A0AAD7ULP3_9STRA|nr:hypothetical protein CTAYLR_004352 [Chrysophaeum taylorii]